MSGGPAGLDVAVVQVAAGLDPAENRATLARLVHEVTSTAPADLVVLPEAFARDFGAAGSDVAPFAEPLDGLFAAAVSEAAAAGSTTVVAGMFETGDDPARPLNTLVVRGGVEAAYRKIHLYDSFGYRESDRLSPGPTTPAVVELGGLRLGLMTCYDLRFPEHARTLVVDHGADVLVLPSAWVAGPGKVRQWQTLLEARAIENTCYVVAAAQPGPRYSGHSVVVDPHGVRLATAAGDGTEVLRARLSREVLVQVRAENPSLANRRLDAGRALRGMP